MAAHSTCIDSVILWVGLLYITRHTDAICHKKAVSCVQAQLYEGCGFRALPFALIFSCNLHPHIVQRSDNYRIYYMTPKAPSSSGR